MFGSLARANSILFTLNDEFSPGSKAPAPGTAGYMTAKFVENGSGGLDLTLDASHLLSSTKVFEFAFNFFAPPNGLPPATSLLFSQPSPGDIKSVKFMQNEANAVIYTVELAFSNGVLSSDAGNNVFHTTITSTYVPTTPLTVAMVNTKGGDGALYYAVAHFSTVDSFYLGANQPPQGDTGVTPLPTAAFGGSALLGCMTLLSRGRRKPLAA
jgi:hypothetical protein